MASSSSIRHSPTSKQDFEKLKKQQKQDKSSNNVSTTKETESSPTSYGATSFFYKLTEIVALTSTAFSDTYNTLTAGGTTEPRPSARKRREYKIVGDVMQINADDSDGAYDEDESSDVGNDEVNKKMGRKDEVKWAVNDDEDEPPPPYDSAWALPKTSTYDDTNPEENNLKDSPTSSPKCTDSNVESDSPSTPKDVQTASPRRRQIRARRPRSPRKLIRKKSTLTEASTPRGEVCDDPDKLLLKVNDKLSDMIAQGRAALTSTVELTEIDILLAEEREREEKIMKGIGQTPVGKRGRKNAVEYDYFTSISDGNYSSPESSSEFGGYGAYNGFVSNGYVESNAPKGFVNGPVSGGFGGSARFGRFGLNNNNGGFGNNYAPSYGAPNVDYSSPEHYEYNSYNAYNGHGNGYVSNGYAEPAIPKGFGAGPVSGGFGGAARFGRFAPSNNNSNSGFGTNYGSFASSNSGYTNGMYNNREFIY